MIETTVVYLRKDNKVLLGKKLRGFGMGKITAPGGKFEHGETPAECVVRECFEETGVRITKFEQVARVVYDDLHYKDKVERDLMHVFVATEWEGEPQDSDELDLEWYTLRDIPYDKMWSDAKIFLPDILRGKKLEAYFHYNEKNEFTDYWVKPINTDILITLSNEDFGFPTNNNYDKAKLKFGARAAVLDKDGRVCITHAVNKGYYKLPGGGQEPGELAYENVEREIHEEVGYKVKNLVSLGRTIELRGGETPDATPRIVDNQVFVCQVEKFIGAMQEEDEIEDGTQTEWFNTIDEAIEAFQNMSLEDLTKISSDLGYRAHFWRNREIAILRAAKKYLERPAAFSEREDTTTAPEDYGETDYEDDI